MIVRELPLDWYIDKMKRGETFSIGMYGDGEFIAMFRNSIGRCNAEGTVYTQALCDALVESLHFNDPTFYFSAPEGLKNAQWSGIGETRIDKFLSEEGVAIDFLEKDCWNNWVRDGLLGPFIKQLRTMNVVVVSNAALRGLDFLNYDHFVELSYPNCFDDIDRVVNDCLSYGKPAVYLIAAGLPATIIAQRLHGKITDSWFLDLGSVWDGFVRIGAQRGWRAELYADDAAYKSWREKNLADI